MNTSLRLKLRLGSRWDTDLAEVEGGRAIYSESFRELTSIARDVAKGHRPQWPRRFRPATP